MPNPVHHRIARSPIHRFLLPLLLLLLFVFPSAHAQLPAGTTDASSSSQSSQQQDPLRAQASAALDQHDLPTALKLLTTLAEKYPTDAHLLYDLAFTQESLDQTSVAADTYRRSISADPRFFEPHLSLGLLLARQGQTADAREQLAAAVNLTPSEPLLKARAYRALARLDQRTRPADASSELLEAIKLSPETPDDILLSAELAEASNDLPAAEATYRRLLVTDPKNPEALAALAHLLIQQKKPSDAETLLNTALADNSGDVTLTAQLASLYADQDKIAQALPLVETLHTSHPNDPAITRLLARLYLRNQQFDLADPLYAALIAVNPQDPTLLDDRADALIHLHRPAEAVPLLKRAIAQPNAFPTKDDLGLAASHLAFAASESNDPVTTLQAIEIRDKVLAQSPASIFLAATAHDKLHHVALATSLYNQFLAVANGKFPDEEWKARHRLLTLAHMK
jgi:tetratricopeptide (TPR) repeat protein